MAVKRDIAAGRGPGRHPRQRGGIGRHDEPQKGRIGGPDGDWLARAPACRYRTRGGSGGSCSHAAATAREGDLSQGAWQRGGRARATVSVAGRRGSHCWRENRGTRSGDCGRRPLAIAERANRTAVEGGGGRIRVRVARPSATCRRRAGAANCAPTTAGVAAGHGPISSEDHTVQGGSSDLTGAPVRLEGSSRQARKTKRDTGGNVGNDHARPLHTQRRPYPAQVPSSSSRCTGRGASPQGQTRRQGSGKKKKQQLVGRGASACAPVTRPPTAGFARPPGRAHAPKRVLGNCRECGHYEGSTSASCPGRIAPARRPRSGGGPAHH